MGLEPTTPCLQSRCSSQLSYVPEGTISVAGGPEAARVRDTEGMADTCTHLDQIRDVAPSGNGCVECLELGWQWVHLRRCTDCGHIGCCDNSPRQARHRPLPLDDAPDHPVVRARRGLVLVLRGRDQLRGRRAGPEPFAHLTWRTRPSTDPIKPFASQQTFATWLDKEPREVGRPLDQDREEGLGDPLGDPRRSPRGRALLRLDRRATQPLRRRVLPPALHTAPRPQHVVGDQLRQGDRVDRRRCRCSPAGMREVERAKADGRWDAAYSVAGDRGDTRPSSNAGFRKNAEGPQVLRVARQPQPVLGAAPHRDREEAGDARAQGRTVLRDAEERRDDPPGRDGTR